MKDKISVVLATYNGEKYLIEQLDSIFYQSRKPDEVIIVDDCSTDNTQLLIKEYIKRRNLKTWILICNDNNLGWKKNFKKGFDLCTGDLIFPCDQDDIWHTDKIELMSKSIKSNKNISVLVSNYNVFNITVASTDRYNKVSKDMLDDQTIEKIPFDEHWMYVRRPGCVYCFRRDFFKKVLKFWDDNLAHDAILWRYSILTGSLFLYNYKTIDFRRHGDNVTGRKKITRQYRIDDCKESEKVNDTCFYIAKKMNVECNYDIFLGEKKFLKYRREFFETKSIIKWIVIVFKYRKYYLSFSNALGDLYINYFGDKHK